MKEQVYIFKCGPELNELISFLSQHIEGGNETLFQKSLILMAVAMKAKLTNHKIVLQDENGKTIDTIDII